MKFKYYKVTDNAFIDSLIKIRDDRAEFDRQAGNIANDVGASECLCFEGGGVAGFKFNSEPDRGVWKKVKYGYMPKKTNKQGSKIVAKIQKLPKTKSINSALKPYGFPAMVMGESTPKGVRLYNPNLFGSYEKRTFFVEAPIGNGCENFSPQSDIFEEVREWVSVKFMEELSKD